MKTISTLVVASLFFIFAWHAQAQQNAYPNEIKGFDFYGKGKLAEIKLGESTEADVEKIFGDCAEKCDQDENWSVQFEYFMSNIKSVPDGEDWKDLFLKPQFRGKLFSITLFPKNRVSFQESDFPSKFFRYSSVMSASHMSLEIHYLGYADEYGLSYMLFDYDAQKGYLNHPLSTDSLSRGDLTEIKYEISNEKQKKMWSEEPDLSLPTESSNE